MNQELNLNDQKIRLFGIPLLGIIIPNLTGLFGPLTPVDPVYWLGYILFIALAGGIWQGNRYLLFRTRRRFTWFDKPVEKLVLLVMNNVFYTAPLTFASLCVWYQIAGLRIEWDTITMVTLVNVISVLFITHVYETVFMLKEQENELLKNADLQRAKAEAELAALKNQVDPHFMFNSLNTLTYLIKKDQNRALEFTENLAELYRYILSQKDQTLVPLNDELEFTGKYTDLLRLRFGNSLIIQNGLREGSDQEFLIPPTSVFVAFENAVKHNEISEQTPMTIHLSISDDVLSIRNTIRQRKNVSHSSRIGLRNLAERFMLIIGKNVVAERRNDQFVVELPLMRVAN